MLAGFAQPNTTEVNLADTKFPSDQMVERHTACDHVAARFAWDEVHAVIAPERFNSLRLNRGSKSGSGLKKVPCRLA